MAEAESIIRITTFSCSILWVRPLLEFDQKCIIVSSRAIFWCYEDGELTLGLWSLQMFFLWFWRQTEISSFEIISENGLWQLGCPICLRVRNDRFLIGLPAGNSWFQELPNESRHHGKTSDQPGLIFMPERVFESRHSKKVLMTVWCRNNT